MKKTFPVIFLIFCLLLASCGGDAAAFPQTIDSFIATFNDRASDTDYALGVRAEADDGTITVATKDENTSVFCTETDGGLTRIEVEGAGMFQPGLGSFDYMVYALIACDGSLDYVSAGDLIASMYYEAYTGGDAVVMSYGGMKISFLKESYYCLLTIETDASAE